MMLRMIVTSAVLAAAGTIMAADAKEEVTKAAKALGEKSYSWKTTVKVPDSARFAPGPTEGKTDKEIAYVSTSFRDNRTESYIKGDKGVFKGQDGEWQSTADAGEGRGQFMARTLRNFKAPAAQAQEIAGHVKELKKEGDVYSGELTEEGAKALLSFRGGRGGGGDGPEIRGAKGTAKFWVKDGVLSKYEYDVKGQMSFNNNDFDMDRVTTTEIKDVGTATVTVPEEAKKKLG